MLGWFADHSCMNVNSILGGTDKMDCRYDVQGWMMKNLLKGAILARVKD